MKITENTYNSLEFEEISNMNKLIDNIKRHKFYRQLHFVVTEIESLKSEKHKGYKKRENTYAFGNKEYHKNSDVVKIDIYTDCVELSYSKEKPGAIKKDLNVNMAYTLEDKIVLILNEWERYYD